GVIAMNGKTRQYFTMPPAQLAGVYNDADKLRSFLRALYESKFEPIFSDIGLPSYKWHLKLADGDLEPQPLERLVVAWDVEKESYDQIRSAIAKFDGYIGTDLPFFAADHWCPGNSNNRMFGNRRAAHKLVRAGYLEEKGLFGDTVNVVVIDRG